MAKATCVNCNKELGLRKMKTNAGYLCADCYKVCNSSFNGLYLVQSATLDEIKSCFSADGTIAITSNGALAYNPQTWKPTKVVPNHFEVDEENHLWLVPDGALGGKKSPIIHRFDEVSEFELLENGNSITKGGLGRAAVGGILFGGAGAIVGGVTGSKKSKQIISNMQIKITTNNMDVPAIYIDLIKAKTKNDSVIYKMAYNAAQEILSILSIIVKTVEGTKEPSTVTDQFSSADAIRKFKQLLDDGIISQEEFDAKKRELLGI